ncbi:MAG: DUF6273 domain-containing protein [Oscillospiraceae bacterium]|nr:DUF6273 domain-containing protein [Oscillospiraceae bacterium]
MKNLIVTIVVIVLVLGLTACNTNTVANEKEIIQFGGRDWRIIDRQEDKVLIISEEIIEIKKYHAERVEITWEYSTIREYLNGEFIENNFTPEEQSRIIETIIINNDNPYGSLASGGNDTTDKVFLLSLDEANLYFTNDSERIAFYGSGREYWWWLRTPALGGEGAVIVGIRGEPSNNGGNYIELSSGIRPALWISL